MSTLVIIDYNHMINICDKDDDVTIFWLQQVVIDQLNHKSSIWVDIVKACEPMSLVLFEPMYGFMQSANMCGSFENKKPPRLCHIYFLINYTKKEGVML